VTPFGSKAATATALQFPRVPLFAEKKGNKIAIFPYSRQNTLCLEHHIISRYIRCLLVGERVGVCQGGLGGGGQCLAAKPFAYIFSCPGKRKRLGLLRLLEIAGLALCLNATAATYTVTSTNDTGAGTLRDAITQANALPTIVDSVVIDGTTQSGYSGTPLIELNGANATNIANGVYIQSSNCVIRGLAINRFNASGIVVENGASNVIQGNFIGPPFTIIGPRNCITIGWKPSSPLAMPGRS
jgi:hypothetical protein